MKKSVRAELSAGAKSQTLKESKVVSEAEVRCNVRVNDASARRLLKKF